MKQKIFEQICFKRIEILKERQYDFAKALQFIDVDVALLLKEREEMRRLLTEAIVPENSTKRNLLIRDNVIKFLELQGDKK